MVLGALEPGTSSPGPLSVERVAGFRRGSFGARSFWKRARPFGDSLAGEEEEHPLKCKIRCLDMLNNHPLLIQATMQRLSDAIAGLTDRNTSKLGDTCDAKARRIPKVPLTCNAAYCLQNLPNETKVFCYLHALSGGSPVPQSCLGDVVFRSVQHGVVRQG